MLIIIYICLTFVDKFLPRACELAMSSSNRQTKVAACELVHSLVLLLLGNVFTKSQQMKDKKPADDVFKKLFPVLLQLAVDIELVRSYLIFLLKPNNFAHALTQ